MPAAGSALHCGQPGLCLCGSVAGGCTTADGPGPVVFPLESVGDLALSLQNRLFNGSHTVDDCQTTCSFSNQSSGSQNTSLSSVLLLTSVTRASFISIFIPTCHLVHLTNGESKLFGLAPGAHAGAVLCAVGEELQKSRKAARDAVLPPPEARRSSAVELGCLLAGTFFLD